MIRKAFWFLLTIGTLYGCKAEYSITPIRDKEGRLSGYMCSVDVNRIEKFCSPLSEISFEQCLEECKKIAAKEEAE